MSMNLGDPRAVLAGTVWGEARGGGRAAMEDVASVVLNRVRHPTWWGHDVLSVCLDPWQFSCWNGRLPGQPLDPNFPKTIAATPADPSFALALAVADDALAGRLVDHTLGADSYFAIGITPPDWTARATHTVDRWQHSFWRVMRPAPGSDATDPVHGTPDAPTVRARTADDLNAAELASLAR